ncbi:hypothetical protein ASG59_18730 [Methylobacterium sp. Leaf466]|nr:hypothetical protein ASG59_18730 [Methylobacterium sp. Leaf466]
MSFFTELQGDIKEALFNSTAAQLDERERLYSQHKGITDVLATMQLYASRAEAIIEARQVTIDPYDD